MRCYYLLRDNFTDHRILMFSLHHQYYTHTHIILIHIYIHIQQLQQQLTAVRNSAVNNLLVEEKELEKAVLTLEKVIVCVLPIVIHPYMHHRL